MMKRVKIVIYLLKISSPLLSSSLPPHPAYLDYWIILEMKNRTVTKLLPPKLHDRFTNRRDMNTLWISGKRRMRVHGTDVEWIIDCRCSLSNVKTLVSSQTGTGWFASWDSGRTGHLFVLYSCLVVPGTAGTGTQQHSNYWINSMKLIVSVVNSITVFWVCFIWSNYALPIVCKSVLHLDFSPSLQILQALMTKISPMSLTQDKAAPSRLCTARSFVTCSSSFQESTF